MKIALVLVLGVVALAGQAVAAPAPGSQLIDCSQADTRVDVTVSSHLDPTCTWTRGVRILASDVVFDCQGARIVTTDRQRGIEIAAPTTTALSNITVRHCEVEGFLNNVRITRDGFRELAEGLEYEHAFSNIVIEDSTFRNSRGVGVFVDGYVTGVTLRNLRVEGAGSSGIYLEAGSKDNVVENNDLIGNGFGENGPSGQPFDFGSVTFWFWGTGREGLSIDGSRFNRIANNRFSGNAYGGIFLYKNCGEYVNARPERWWHRRYGADGNVIENNTFTGGFNGVWIGSRMGENLLPMDCSDPQYAPGYALDYADANTIRNNVFQDVAWGVRVEDDQNVITGNQFSGAAAQQAVVIGTPNRTATLGLPVAGTTVTGNVATIPTNPNPYRWVHGHTGTTFSGNLSLGRPSGLCEGVPPWRGPFVMAVAFVIYDPMNPPSGDPPTIPLPEPLPACPLACSSAAAATSPAIVVSRLETPPGDDALSFRGRALLPHPFAPALDPAANGVGVVLADVNGARLLDLVVAGGAWDAATKRGWRAAPSGRRWRYNDKTAAPAGGVTHVTVKDLSSRQPGLIEFQVKGRGADYAAAAADLPLSGWLLLDPPTAETGQCAAAAPVCSGDARGVVCR